MPSTEYFRRQSDICLRLSLIASDDDVASRLIVMAQEYKAKADELAAESKPRMAVIIAHNGCPTAIQTSVSPPQLAVPS